MKKFYNYILYPNPRNYTFDEPLSAMLCTTVEQAYKWAERLLNFNTSAFSVSFKADNGRRVYFVRLEDDERVRGKY